MSPLTPAQRRALRARAHHLRPVVRIGAAGLTPAVLDEIDSALRSHELIKIRVLGEDRLQRAGLIGEICAALAASPVQHIGKILVIYRPRPEREPPRPRPGKKAGRRSERGCQSR